MIKKSDDRAAGVRFVYHENDYDMKLVNHKNYKKKNNNNKMQLKREEPSYEKKGKFNYIKS